MYHNFLILYTSIDFRKDLQNLGAMETTLLYILHWILLDSAEECCDTDGDINNPFYYLFSIPTMTVTKLIKISLIILLYCLRKTISLDLITCIVKSNY